jgi:hypothetical protein
VPSKSSLMTVAAYATRPASALVFCIAFATGVVACSQPSSSPSAMPPSNPSSAPAGHTNKRDILTDTLAALPVQDRKHVVLFQDGRIYSTDERLRKTAFYYRPTSNADTFLDPTGRIVTVPDAFERPNASNTGVAHTRYSASTANDDFDQATVNVACSSTKLLEGQDAYIYLGGTGSPLGGAFQADFGLQIPGHGSQGDPAAPAHGQIYLFAQGAGAPVGVGGTSIGCDSTVTLRFYVALRKPQNDIVLALDVVSGGVDTTTVLPVPKRSGWNVPCAGCQVKRATTLAIPSKNAPNGVGTYFGITNPYATPAPTAPVPDITWQAVTESSSGASAVGNPGLQHSWVETTESDTPGAPLATGVVRLNVFDAADENVGINESGPRLGIHSKQ